MDGKDRNGAIHSAACAARCERNSGAQCAANTCTEPSHSCLCTARALHSLRASSCCHVARCEATVRRVDVLFSRQRECDSNANECCVVQCALCLLGPLHGPRRPPTSADAKHAQSQ